MNRVLKLSMLTVISISLVSRIALSQEASDSEDPVPDEAKVIDSEDLATAITESFKKAIEEVDARKSEEEAREEEVAASALDPVIREWVQAKRFKRAKGLKRKIDQDWQNLLSTPPQHIDYYLRDFSYSIGNVNIEKVDLLQYPYRADVDIEEILYVEQAPLIAEPRSDYQFSAYANLRIRLKYQKEGSSWYITDTEVIDPSLKKGWPQAVRKRHTSFFIPAE